MRDLIYDPSDQFIVQKNAASDLKQAKWTEEKKKTLKAN